MDKTTMDKTTQEVYDFLMEESSSKKHGSTLAEIILIADPEFKQKGFDLKAISLPVRLRHAIKEILHRLDAAQELETAVRLGRIEHDELTLPHLVNPDNTKILITLPMVTSVKSEAKNELIALPVLMSRVYGILGSRRGVPTYGNGQIILFGVDSQFLNGMIESLRPIVNGGHINYANAELLYEQETMGNVSFDTHGNKVISLGFHKSTSGIVTDYPNAYEKVSNLIAGLVSKWVNQKDLTKLSASAREEHDTRLARFGGSREQALERINSVFSQQLVGLDNGEWSETIHKALMPKHVVNLPIPYNAAQGQLSLIGFYMSIGGDSRMLPALRHSLSANEVSAALTTISSGANRKQLISERFMFGAFKFLGLESTINSTKFSARKVIPYELERALVQIKGRDNQLVLLDINKVGGKIGTESFILSDAVWSDPNTPKLIKDKFENYHSATASGYVQKGTMSLSSLVRTDDKKDDSYANTPGAAEVFKAIDILSFASTLFKYSQQGHVDKLKSDDKKQKASDKKKAKCPPGQTTQFVPAQNNNLNPQYGLVNNVPMMGQAPIQQHIPVPMQAPAAMPYRGGAQTQGANHVASQPSPPKNEHFNKMGAVDSRGPLSRTSSPSAMQQQQQQYQPAAIPPYQQGGAQASQQSQQFSTPRSNSPSARNPASPTFGNAGSQAQGQTFGNTAQSSRQSNRMSSPTPATSAQNFATGDEEEELFPIA